MSGVKIKDIWGNTLEFVNSSLMWLTKRITITIIIQTAIVKIKVNSDS